MRPSLARLVAEEDPSILEDVERLLEIRLEFLADPAAPLAGYEILQN